MMLEEARDALRGIRSQSLVLEEIEGMRVVQRQAIAFEQCALVDGVRVPGVGEDVRSYSGAEAFE